ncbi:MAG: hypothetical protein K0S09_31 [Sphingobacteriaceae bacterium]|jgi:hypothetical protein|nr:hypothetical protein [Sphingobacteriaceae bacterium]
MRIEPIAKQDIELSVKKKKEVKHELIGKIIPFEGHSIWQINNETLEVDRAKFNNATYHLFGDVKKEIIIKPGFSYISALNAKNALKKFKQGRNGSKPISDEPMAL